MHINARNLIGQRFGRLVVLEDSGERSSGAIVWECICDCGTRSKVRSSSLVKRKTTSCGCYRKELLMEHSQKIKTHNLSRKRIYRIWKHMLKRCYDNKSSNYNFYGKRGITVCDEWRNDVTEFNRWALANGYDDTLTIERIDVNKDYSPKNCTWIPMEMQANNKRNTIRYKGKSLRLWVEQRKLNYNTVKYRLRQLNWPIEEALGLKEHVFSRERYESSLSYKYYKMKNEKRAIVRKSDQDCTNDRQNDRKNDRPRAATPVSVAPCDDGPEPGDARNLT